MSQSNKTSYSEMGSTYSSLWHVIENVPNAKMSFNLKPYQFAHEQIHPLLGNRHAKPTTHLHHRRLPSAKTDEHVWLVTQSRHHPCVSAAGGKGRRRDVTSVSLACIVSTVETRLTLPREGCSSVCCCGFLPDRILPLVELLLFRPLK